ncbi:MAG: KH domain-containing protein [Mastigocoleus sp. MO_167.B18]|uniref:KH domain-containing protein n=1 Tax=Mastigocoleus sp. MO_188.B34 TaxID=3036635 RepID=UPI00263933EB|nr:KH domain-containing protein [Mastigocoleus sp. MO_188.B34]MDJ0696511.1 KH domain-containing protein [Mastigocoleus sp. MO_188.B34]MDJ0772366.1 KH domain-containing protein [Mastigocoleus sp. MO_167.B18]
MFSNRSVQHPYPKNEIKYPRKNPDYVGLVRYLMQPFLDSAESLSVDCELSGSRRKRAWIRIAFDNTDKGKIFGRGGRNIQAIRTVVAAAAEAAGHSVYFDIYGSTSGDRDSLSGNEEGNGRMRLPPPKSRERRGNVSRPVSRTRFR